MIFQQWKTQPFFYFLAPKLFEQSFIIYKLSFSNIEIIKPLSAPNAYWQRGVPDSK